ncbi:tetratricopeptide repeat protein [Rosettibacter firmus]|uniref:tetratricopeptide repeat protein n=1 Tax=Rosettibacter firmus TaxID=3111522 RepID=UPI00336BDD53
MLEKKKKITKKEIKHDPLVTSYYRAYNFFLENQAKILIGLAVVALIIVSIIIYSNKRSSDNITAANLLSKVIPLYNNGMYHEAIYGQKAQNITGLKTIVENYGNTEQGEAAKIFLANSYLFLGKVDSAYQFFKDYDGSNLIFKAASLAGQAVYFETKKEYEKAVDAYKKAAKISKENPLNADYLLKAGIDLLKLNRKEEAKEVFEIIKKEYKSYPEAREVERYLIQVES